MKSSFAKKQLEKYGWKEGSGLGRDGAGITTFVKVQRRDPQLTSGIGHEASSGGTVNSDMGLDAVLMEIKKPRGERQDQGEVDEAAPNVSASPSAFLEGKAEGKGKRGRSPNRPSQATAESSSSSSSDDDDDARVFTGSTDITQWDDKKLLEHCGGVRLGRTGRHRFFNGKLARIEQSHSSKK